MKDIEINVGLHTDLYFDLSKVDFAGIESIILTIKNLASIESPVIVEREFTSSGKHKVTITPEESILLEKGAVYDLTEVREDGTTYPCSKIGRVVLEKRVGGKRG